MNQQLQSMSVDVTTPIGLNIDPKVEPSGLKISIPSSVPMCCSPLHKSAARLTKLEIYEKNDHELYARINALKENQPKAQNPDCCWWMDSRGKGQPVLKDGGNERETCDLHQVVH
ncbi:hypothetical protein OS493_001944 [Desmophyllum pertusum]|uniref:Uncharacterized protein n=1 Tax=Desmophyllum pertusum TaxID=174260 RepID=A0A9W9Z593_9CNID|nr:hypothetical protein OS493_001944 [Desmophyllum pertusum]